MNHYLKKLATTTLVAGVTLTSLCAAAPAHNAPHPRRTGAHRERLAALGLTDQQKTAVKEVLQKHQDNLRPLVDKLVTERRALQDLIHSGKADEATIRAQSAKVAATASDLAVLRARIAAELRPLLSADQIAKLEELKEQLRDRIDQRRARIAKPPAE